MQSSPRRFLVCVKVCETHTRARAHAHTHNENRKNKNRARKAVKENVFRSVRKRGNVLHGIESFQVPAPSPAVTIVQRS